ncbi:hypothetical protein CEUSTIGMA_g13904.t1 [Chlamydomonas eustigma]|uniref:Amine oxidase domain-containing protein n=1 Tax=Chlamydomonas eustigma TaxID=1157962 RepID=A0A250XTX9_9CHLO|nr:hypothetical protein CEUSTIGMA_g13904.t1 [Chlamydomonas eustigma]|eukprot:GAX86496.1 hypothetical protein CEUSTIGMA_g13904.t1 [Chlamydomonas eustigma]
MNKIILPGDLESSELDFYNASALLPLSDQEIQDRALSLYLPKCISGFQDNCKVEDASILRFRSSVTAFSPGSRKHMPEVKSDLQGVMICGDWVRQAPGLPQGLSQEKAYVTGLQAGNSAAEYCKLRPVIGVERVEADEPHVVALREVVRARRALGGPWLQPNRQWMT